MKCEHCHRTIEEEAVFVTVAVSGAEQRYHAVPAVDTGMSCWQYNILAWAGAIEARSVGKRAKLDAGAVAVGSTGSLRRRVQRQLGASRMQ